jgi:serine/threonine protein kinase
VALTVPFPIGSRLGAYEITGELGAGGMGEVYRAFDTDLKREVAVKSSGDDGVSAGDFSVLLNGFEKLR